MNKQSLNTLAGVFGRCFLVSLALQAVSTLLWILIIDWATELHVRLFQVTADEMHAAAYMLFAHWKTLNVVLFFVPWAGLKLTARRLPQ